jgi:hypothetical protein
MCPFWHGVFRVWYRLELSHCTDEQDYSIYGSVHFGMASMVVSIGLSCLIVQTNRITLFSDVSILAWRLPCLV